MESKMKTVFGVLGAFTLALCVFPPDVNGAETELPLSLMDLPAELRLDIFEQLDFFDLICVSKTHPENRNLIETIFRNLLKNREFCIIFIDHLEKIKITFDDIDIATIGYEDTTGIFDEVLDFLQHFGHCITKLRYEYNPSLQCLCERVHKHIGKYVAESVIEISFELNGYQAINGSLNDLIVPYTNCKIANLWYIEIDAVTLHYMFPAVESLDLGLNQMEESLNHFPYLKRLKTPLDWTVKKSQFPLLKQTLELNPQIEHLILWKCDHWEFLKALNEMRPDLKGLEICNLGLDSENATEPLRFADMKIFKGDRSVVDQSYVHGIPFEFGNLEEIALDGIENIDRWVEIMMQNKRLKKIAAYSALRREHFEQIANELPKLEEFTESFYFGGPYSVQDIVDFLQNAKQLKRVSFTFLKDDQCSGCQHLLKNDWINVKKNSITCSFVRK